MAARDPLRDGVDGLASGRGSVLSVLPTLVTALVIAGASFLCREPSPVSAPAPAKTAVHAESSAPAAGFGAGSMRTPAPGDTSPVPAALAFGLAFPLSTETEPLPAVAALQPPRIALAHSARRCAGARCDEAHAGRRPDAARGAATAVPRVHEAAETRTASRPARIEPEEDDALPDLALPFAPTAAVITRAARTIGGAGAALGVSVVDLFASAP